MEIEELKEVVSKLKSGLLVGVLFLGYYFMSQNQTESAQEHSISPFAQSEVEGSELNEVESVDEEMMTHIFIDIKGAVNRPGMYQLEKGARIFDAIEAASGLTDEAASETINLARLLEDQMLIYIPTRAELEASLTDMDNPNEQANIMMTADQDNSGNSLVNINRADQVELETLPGIGPAKAQAIIQYRQEYGSFQRIQDLMEVSGIGEKTFNQLEDRITVQ